MNILKPYISIGVFVALSCGSVGFAEVCPGGFNIDLPLGGSCTGFTFTNIAKDKVVGVHRINCGVASKANSYSISASLTMEPPIASNSPAMHNYTISKAKNLVWSSIFKISKDPGVPVYFLMQGIKKSDKNAKDATLYCILESKK